MKYNPNIVLAFFRSQGLPACVTELQFHSTRKWRFDFAFPDERIAIEVQGGVWNRGAHGRGSGIVKDMEKSNEAHALGWIILYCVPSDIATMDMVNLIKRCVARNTGKL